ncbi:MAG: AAA family ATPase [Candidatus Saccharimonas aalborgensis]
MPSTLIIRGNSGSGKTTVAKELRARISDGLSGNTLLVQQDVLRRDMLRERDMPEKCSVIELIELVVEFGRRQGRIVILEGILVTKKYGPMLRHLANRFDEVYVYYLDIPFEETLRRHATKPNAHEFGEKEMREWWNDRDYLVISNEKILTKELSVEDIVDTIIDDMS